MTTFTSKLAYNEACDKFAAWEDMITAVEALESKIDGLVINKHIDEKSGQIMKGSLNDWLSDREGDNDICDLRDAIILFEHLEVA